MSYQVIARKWRPQTFEEVTGQEHITRTLRNAVEHERLHHAYLFSGARGVGKTTTARLLAKAVNCHRSERPTPAPCRATDPDACPSCREIAESRSIDVLEIDAASNTGIDNVRDVIFSIIDRNPARDRYQVFIIDEVHMLSNPAFNALLKTLEEPPPRVLFIMATTHAHKIPETILSRCQQFEFRTIAAPKIAERLRLIADAEKIKVTDEALREVARAGEGSMRDAQSAFDQVISFSGGKIEAADVEAALGIAGRELLARVMRAVAEAAPAEALAVVDELTTRGHELRNFCRDLLAHLRDLLVAPTAPPSSSSPRRGAAGGGGGPSFSAPETPAAAPERPAPRQAETSAAASHAHTPAAAPTRTPAESPVRKPAAAAPPPSLKLVPPPVQSGGTASFASGAASRVTEAPFPVSDGAPSSGLFEQPRAFVEGARAGEDRVGAPVSLVTTPQPDAATAQAPAPDLRGMEVGGMGFGPDDDASRFKRGLEGRGKPLLAVALDGARRVWVEGEEVRVEFAPEGKHLRETLMKPENMRLLREVCCESLGREVGISVRVRAPGEEEDEQLTAEDEARREQRALRERAEGHPVVQQVLKTFRAEIVDVRRTDAAPPPQPPQ
ncbi:MAG: DNA polymerase III subunit gamma/tau [Acidobacteria bacterium]|nr:DNA polymerase III subunit gamma/tau [Acidobacteriota bacterium]